MKKETLTALSETLLKETEKAVDWIDNFGGSQKERFELIKNKIKIQNSLNAIDEGIANAVYGESQAGKSTFVSNFIGNAENKLMISNGKGEAYDFIEHINPKGLETEATGLITRFTSSKKTSDYDVTIKLLSPRDLILILVDSYLSDFDKWKVDEISVSEVNEFWAKASRSRALDGDLQEIITSDDIYFIQYYLEYYYANSLIGKSKLLPFFEADYWTNLANNISRIPVEKLHESISILWGENETITTLFRDLMSGLKQLNFDSHAYCNFDLILNTVGELIDVKTVLNFGVITENTNIYLSNQSQKQIDKSLLAMLSAEIVLRFQEYNIEGATNDVIKKRLKAKKEVIDKSDFLDYPGIRARNGFDENNGMNQKKVVDMFLRGKLEYLFNSYDISNRIDNFFVVTVSKNSEIKGLRKKLSKWISQNIGSNKEERDIFLSKVHISPLFLIINQWDRILQNDTYNENMNLEEKLWDRRLFDNLKANIYSSDTTNAWNENWTNSNPYFQNTYPFRAKKYSEGAFSQENGVESFINPEYHQRLSESFAQSPTIKKVFGESRYQEIWDSSSRPNYDGCDYLLQNVLKASEVSTKIRKHQQILRRCTNETLELLEKYYESESHTERVGKAHQKFKDISRELEIGITNRKIFFGDFVENFMLSENEVYNQFHTLIMELSDDDGEAPNERVPYVLIRESVKDWYDGFVPLNEKKPEASHSENFKALQKHWGEATVGDTKRRCEKEAIDWELLFYGTDAEISGNPPKSNILSKKLIEYWLEHRLSNAVKQLPKEQQDSMFEVLAKGVEKLRLQNMLEHTLSPFVNRDTGSIQEPMVAHLATGLINKYVASVGWEYYTEEDKKRLENIFNSLGMKQLNRLKEKDETNKGLPSKKEVGELLDSVSEEGYSLEEGILLKKMNEWRTYLLVLFTINADAKLDKPGNKELGTILTQLKAQTEQLTS
jgi:hypothetical protein